MVSKHSTQRLRFRVLTANVQSFPESAMAPEQALDDLKRNADDADLVFLQEIADRYRPLVGDAFPAPEWQVFYGNRTNSEPIAFRSSLFTLVAGDATLLHPANHMHGRRHTTHLRLTFNPLGSDFHATNLHLVAGAFNNTERPDKARRVDEWNEAITKHRAFVDSLVHSGLPVVGGGDYNRQLRRYKSLGTERAGKPVSYAVDPGSIDLLWFVDGDRSSWRLGPRTVFPARDRANAQRHSDHAAREVTVALSAVRQQRPEVRRDLPGPFVLTTFGDKSPKKVDWKTRAALEEAQRRLGYPLTIVQGSYNHGGVSASAGTHDGGGVVDLLAWDWRNKVRVLRSLGFAAWHRPTIRGLWGEHIHAVLIDHGRLSSSAAAQVASYRAGRDGLKGNRPDPFWRPRPIPVFEYPPKDLPTVPTPSAPPTPRVPVDATRSPYPPFRNLDGVDTSHHQGGPIDVKAAQAAGLRWWYLKTTEGTTAPDRTYAKRMQQARRAGIPVGSYHFARPDLGDAAQEARYFLAHADIRAGDMLPMLDLESLEGLSRAQVTRWTGNWVATVSAELAHKGLVAKPIIYTRFDLGSGFGCLLWVARYSDPFRAPVIPRPWRRAAIWQHSDGRYGPVKSVPGFGPVDVNAVHPDIPLSALRVRSARPAAPPTPPAVQPAPKPARRSRATPRPVPVPPTEDVATDLQALRSELRAAVQNLEAALDSLPER